MPFGSVRGRFTWLPTLIDERKVLMKLAIFVNQDPITGGGHYESLNRISNLQGEAIEISLYTSNQRVFDLLRNQGKEVHFIKLAIYTRFFLFLRKTILDISSRIIPGNVTPTIMVKKFITIFNSFERPFKKRGVDLIYFTSPESNAVYLESTNYIFAVWDLAHFEIPFFPEIRENHVFETREYLYRTALPRAYAITVGHSFTKKTLVEKYHQNPEKVFILPFLPSRLVIDKEDNIGAVSPKDLPDGLPASFVYYPAQYAAHKNHIMVIDLIQQVKIKGKGSIGAVFTGADRGNKKFLMHYVKSLGLETDVIFLDFQPDSSVFALLKSAIAVMAPTYIGPGTLPTMEAMYVGTPIFVLDNWQNREFYSDAAYYLNRSRFDESIQTLRQLSDKNKRREFAIKMRQRYEKIIEADETKLLKRHVSEFSALAQTKSLSE